MTHFEFSFAMGRVSNVRMLTAAAALALCGFVSGCDDNETVPTGTGGTTSSGGSGGSTGGSGGTGGVGGTGGATTGGGGMGGAPAPQYAALVRGTLFTTDMTEAQTQHDMLASGGESAAKAAGDVAHHVFLGTALLGTQENQFLAMDRWTSVDGMQTFYSNPDFQAAFGALFSGPPMLETFERQPEWHTWGDITSAGDVDPHFWVVVRGHLKESDPAAAQAAHDMVAAGGEGTVTALGDVAHIVFTGLADPQEFLAVDVWTGSDNMATVYTNPDFQAAFGALFDAPPSLGVYQSTNWHQW
ncbi:MAG: hypothetical protein IPK82_25845 [Polyangiaceae bacterium]|nr:hypothetical protein [Polyangiaceae bacterium]